MIWGRYNVLEPFCYQNWWNSSIIKRELVLVTTISGSPNCMSKNRSELFNDSSWTSRGIQKASSGHQEPQGMSSYSYIRNGPARSRWSLAHGWVGHFHRCKGATEEEAAWTGILHIPEKTFQCQSQVPATTHTFLLRKSYATSIWGVHNEVCLPSSLRNNHS